MARNEVKLTFRISDDGTLKLLTNKTKKAKKATDDLTKSTDAATSARNRYNKAEKGAAGLGANTTKNFSKMNQTMGGSSGLVAAYATLAANAFALTAAFNALRRAASFTQLVGGLTEIGSAAGQNLPYVADQLRQVTDNAISAEQALRATAVATSSGFSPEQLTKLTKVAKGASIALGRDMGDALDRLVRGTAKVEPEILDELGIIVRLDEATRNFAASLGKTAGELTTFERQQAFLNATIEQGEKKFGEIAQNLQANPFDQLAASALDLVKNILEVLNVGLVPLIKLLSQNQFALFGAFLLFIKSVSSSLIPSVGAIAKSYKEVGTTAAAAFKSSGTVINAEYKKQVAGAQQLLNTTKVLPASVKRIAQEYQLSSLSVKDLNLMVRRLKQSEDLRFTALKANGLNATALKIEEFNQTRALRLEIEALTNAEAKRLTVNAAGSAAGALSRSGRRASAVFGAIGGAGMFGGFKAAAKGARNEFRDVMNTFKKDSKTLGVVAARANRTSNAFRAVGLSARFMGAAFLNAIPGLGTILLIGSFLFEPFMKLINTLRGVDPEVSKVVESFESFEDINLKLAKNIDKSENSTDAFVFALKAQIGVIEQLESGIADLIIKEEERRKKNRAQSIERLIQLRKEVAALEAAGPDVNPLSGVDNNALLISSKKNQIASLESSLNAPQTPVGQLPETVRKAQTVINGFFTELNNNPTLRETFDVEQLSKIRELFYSGDMKKGLEEYKKFTSQFKSLEAAIDQVPEQLNEVNKGVLAFRQTAEGPLEKLGKKFRQLGVEVATVAGDSRSRGLVDMNKDLLKMAIRVGKVTGRFVEAAEAPTIMAQELFRSSRELETIKQKSKEVKEVSKDLAQIAAKNPEAQALSIDLQNQSIQFLIREQDIRERIARLTLSGVELQKELAGIDAKRSALVAQIVQEEEKEFKVAKSAIAQQRRLLDLANKRLAVQDKLVNAEVRAEKARKAAGQGGRIGAKQAADIEAKGVEKRLNLEDQRLQNRLTAIELEFKLLDAQILFEKKRLNRIIAEADAKGDIKTGTEARAARSALNVAAGASSNAQAELKKAEKSISKLTKEALQFEQVMRDYAIQQQIATAEVAKQESFIEMIRGLGGEMLADQMELNHLTAQKRDLEKEINQLMSDPVGNRLEILQKEAELLNLILKRQQKQGERFSKPFSRMAERTGGVAGAAMEGAGQIIGAQASVQDDVAFLEQARDPNYIAPGTMAGNGVTAEEAEANLAEHMAKVHQAQYNIAAAHEQIKSKAFETTVALMESTAAAVANLGPEGQIMAPLFQSMAVMTQSLQTFSEAAQNMTEGLDFNMENLKNKSTGMAATLSAGFASVSAGLSNIMALTQARTNMAVAAIDKEIAAEKKRDGKSKESVAKIKQLEAKKEAMKRKQFEKDKKLQMAMVIMNTASGIAAMLPGVPFTIPFMAMIAALGAAQLAIISGMSYQGGGSAPSAGGPSAIEMGDRRKSTDLARSQSARGELAYFRGEQGTGGPENFRNAFTGMKYRATGGNTAFMVGEQGPELFVPDRPGTIVPNDEVTQAAPTNVNFSISAVDAAGVEDLLIRQQGNIIGMIREAANSYGQDFVETVDTSVFNDTTGGVSRY